MQPLELVPDNSPLTIVMDGVESSEIIEAPLTVNITMNVHFVPFYFTATEGQTDFVLVSAPMANGVLLFAINGIFQSQAKGDFSIVGSTITVSSGLKSGDIAAGIYAQSV